MIIQNSRFKPAQKPSLSIFVMLVVFFGCMSLLSSAQAKMELFDPVRGVLTLAPIFEKAMPGVVEVNSRAGEGSGVVVDARRGYILTNSHVIGRARRATITIKGVGKRRAKIVGSVRSSDIAILKIAPGGLTEIPMGNSDDLRVGDFVYAIGNPFGYQRSVSSGMVSGLGRRDSGRRIGRGATFIQTDAASNPGNSGGALINSRGELVGISSAGIGGTDGTNTGVALAVPINTAKAVMSRFVKRRVTQRRPTHNNSADIMGGGIHDPDILRERGRKSGHTLRRLPRWQ